MNNITELDLNDYVFINKHPDESLVGYMGLVKRLMGDFGDPQSPDLIWTYELLLVDKLLLNNIDERILVTQANLKSGEIELELIED